MHNYGQNPGTYYYVNDHLGTPQQLITATGLVVWQAAYLPYGEAQVRIDLVENNLRFPGQYFDAESGLHYNWNRYYDAQTGRYISADPIGLQGGMNVYAYVGGNPVNWFDPEGLFMLAVMIDARNVECKLDGACVKRCLDKDPVLPFALSMSPASLLNLKYSKDRASAKRNNGVKWTSIDKKWPWLPGANPRVGATRPAGTVQRMKPVGVYGTGAVVLTTFGISYPATSIIRCLSICITCICNDDFI